MRIQFEKLAPEVCFVVNQIHMRESMIMGFKAVHRPRTMAHTAIYLGPLAQVADDFRGQFQRGQRMVLNIHDWQQLSGSPVTGQFLLLPSESTADRRGS